MKRRLIVPRTPLLQWFAIVVVPFATLLPMLASITVIGAAVLALFVVVVVIDAGFGRRHLQGISVELPDLIRLTTGRRAQIELRLRNESMQRRQLLIGLGLPPEIESERPDLLVALPGTVVLSQLSWPCTPRQRGTFLLDAVHVEITSPLGLWAARASLPAHCELRIYPNLERERKDLTALFLNRGPFGLHVQRQVGRGREFEKLREYIAGDSYDEIHWKATAKRGHPVTKIFQIERTQELYVVIDASRLSARRIDPSAPVAIGTGSVTGDPRSIGVGRSMVSETPLARDKAGAPTTLERFITAALTLGLAAEQQGDLFGLVTFSDRVHRFVRARNGKEHYGLCRDAIYALEPRLVAPDFDELNAFLRLRMRRRALLVFLTSLDDPVVVESFTRGIELLARRHLVLVSVAPPPGARPLFVAPDVSSVDQIYERLGGHLLWHDLRQLGQKLQHRGVHFVMLEDERMSAQLVSQYLGIKQRQLL